MAATLRGRFVETESAGMEETTGFGLEDVTVVEADPGEGPDPKGETIILAMPSAAAAANWVGKEVEVEGHFEQRGGASRQVLVVESIDGV